MSDDNSSIKRGHITIPSAAGKNGFPRGSGETSSPGRFPRISGETHRAKRRRRTSRVRSLDAEIRDAARQIEKSGMAEAMKAAALMIVARKLDEVRQLLVSSGLVNNGVQTLAPQLVPAYEAVKPRPVAAPPPVPNPCVQCGRQGVYKTKPNPFNRTGSWYCRAHLALGGQIEAEDRQDQILQPNAPPPPPTQVPAYEAVKPKLPGLASPGASSLAEAMGIAEVINE